MFESHGIHTRLYYVLKRVCNTNKGLDLNNICNLYNVPIEDAEKLNKYGNTKEFIKENGLLYTLGCIAAMEVKKEKEYKQFKENFAPMYSMVATMASSFMNQKLLR